MRTPPGEGAVSVKARFLAFGLPLFKIVPRRLVRSFGRRESLGMDESPRSQDYEKFVDLHRLRSFVPVLRPDLSSRGRPAEARSTRQIVTPL